MDVACTESLGDAEDTYSLGHLAASCLPEAVKGDVNVALWT